MDYDELLFNKIDDLPLQVSKDSAVLSSLEKVLNEYEEKICQFDNFPYFDKVKEINNILVNTLKYYYNGMPNKAYLEIEKLFSPYFTEHYVIDSIDKIGYEDEYRQLYRARVGEEIVELKDIFQNPFYNRHQISTERYSIPGFPCLYLSGSVLGCWLELNKPDLNKFYVSRFEADNKLKVLDLANLPQDVEELGIDKEKYLVTWPLICACSIKVNEKDRIFKSEYVIPQLILQAVRELHNINGIRYFSSKADYKITKCNPVHINFVFPAEIGSNIKQNGDYSEILTDSFRLTPPINTVFFENLNATGKQNIITAALNRRKFPTINVNYYRRNTPVKVAKGYVVAYSGLNFFWMEEFLCKIPVEDIDV